MVDTQWPRYEVFEKERPDWPHRHAGSVHAPDDEMALELARDVFVRRPTCLSLWVVPSSQILTKTAEQLAEDDSWRQVPVPPEAVEAAYVIFQKKTQRAAETYVEHAGEVMARTCEEALRLALDLPHFAKQAYVWWVLPASAVSASRPEDAPSMFDPALDKPYRSPQFYHVFTEMRQLKDAEANHDE